MSSRINNNPDKLFEFWCEVVQNDPGNKAAGRIVESYPENFTDQQVLNIVPEFAFPCDQNYDHTYHENITSYSFVLTNIDSKWRFGFCRHDPKLSKAMILITYLPWHDLFLKFLNVLAIIKKKDTNEFQAFLREVYNKKVPEQNEALELLYSNGASTFVFKRPPTLPSIPENHNLNLYFNFVEPKLMIEIFAAILNERRIIFTSKNLDVISSCIQAANSFLYPMVWQHIFIPILPLKMKDNLCAPMPFLVGVHDSVFENHVRRDEIGDVVILHCDKKIFESPFDDVKTLPSEIVSLLKRQLNNSSDLLGDRLSRIFLNALVRLIGGYRDAFKFNNPIVFDDETFIDSQPTQFRPFVEKMLHLQIFRQFIEERLEMLNRGEGCTDEFEIEIFRYGNRKTSVVKDRIRNVQDKMNPTIKSAVKSVKSGYRGLKTRIKETSSQLKADGRSSMGHTSMVSSHKRHSAPSSPVFSHRSFYNTDPSHIRLQTNSTLQTNYSTSVLNTYGSNCSPAVSTTSSSASSEINLFQELQTEGFFNKSSNRAKHSNENSSKNRLMMSENAQSKKGQTSDSHSYKTFQSKPMNPPPSSTIDNSRSLFVKDCDKLNNNFDDIPPNDPPPLPPRSSKINHKEPTFKSFVAPLPSTASYDKGLARSSAQQVMNTPSKSETSNKDVTDLINFNDSLSIDDFDPLKSDTNTKVEIPTIVTSFENPIYPFFTPTHMPAKSEEDELLKKYELDKFSVIQNKLSANATNNSNTQKLAKFDDIFGDNLSDENRKTNFNSKTWTKFD